MTEEEKYKILEECFNCEICKEYFSLTQGPLAWRPPYFPIETSHYSNGKEIEEKYLAYKNAMAKGFYEKHKKHLKKHCYPEEATELKVD